MMKLHTLRENVVPAWMRACAREIASSDATLVGFTCMFDQTIASLALAKLVKELAPDKTIALGGYAVRPPTGEAVMCAFTFVDALCVGEGEDVIEPLARASSGEMTLADVPGILIRDAGGAVRATTFTRPVDMNRSPIPNFDDYFADVRALSEDHAVDVKVGPLPLENSRGCWWGAKHHCVFCGIHDDDLAYRARDAEQVLHAMDELNARYGTTEFRFADYILPHRYYATLLPELARRGKPYRITSEMKANVTAERFELLADAGFTEVQPGIESFATPVLRSMDKGTTGVQNVHTLLLGKEHDVTVHYNLLYGLPNDEEATYRTMAAALPRLRHLDPPSTRIEIQITRYAPLQADPQRFGIPAAIHEKSYELIFSRDFLMRTGFDLDAYCYYFERPFINGARLRAIYRDIADEVDRWKMAHSVDHQPGLWFDTSLGGITVIDERGDDANTLHLGPVESALLRGCRTPARIERLLEACADIAPRERLEHGLRELDRLGVVFIDGESLVALVLPRRAVARARTQAD